MWPCDEGNRIREGEAEADVKGEAAGKGGPPEVRRAALARGGACRQKACRVRQR